MKSRLVLWGKNTDEDSIILAYELEPSEKVLTLYIFDFIASNETFFQELLNKWRKREEVKFPENVETFTYALSMSDPVLPDHIKVESTDLLEQARLDWHFVVLSNDLFNVFSSELEDLEEKITPKTTFDQKDWDDLKSFSDKIQAKIKEEVLAWKHSRKLKVRSTKLFNLLKERRTSQNEAINAKFKDLKESINQRLDSVEAEIKTVDKSSAPKLAKVLKSVQKDLKDNSDFPVPIRNGVLKRVNFYYKKVNHAQFGDENKEDYVNYLSSRKEAVTQALKRAEKKKKWLEKEIQFQDKKSKNPRTIMQQQFSGAQKEILAKQLTEVVNKVKDLANVLSGINKKIDRQQGTKKKPATESSKEAPVNTTPTVAERTEK